MTLIQTEPKKITIRKPSKLPAEYQEVKYIESSGTQYIATWYNPKTTTEFEIEYEIVSYNQRYCVPMWTRKDYNLNAYYFWYENNDNSYYGFWNQHTDPSSVAFHWVWVKRKITYHNNILSNWTQSVTVVTNQQPYWNIAIFWDESTWTVQELWAMKIYMFKLREWNNLIRDFIPCYRKADSVIGMYDLVNDVFYTNSWTWTFTKGNDVNLTEKEIKRITIRPNGTEKQIRPAWWAPWANTLAYYPLNWDFNDYSGNNRNLTNSWVTFVSWWLWQVASFASGNNAYYQNNSLFNTASPFTYNVWVNASSIPSWYYYSVHPYYSVLVWWQDGSTITSHCKDLWLCLSNKAIGYCWSWTDYMNWWTINTNTRYNLVFTYDGNTSKVLYVNWIQVATETISAFSITYSNARITLSKSWNAYNTQPFVWQLSNVIVEDKVRAATEVSDYYNLTKWNYWL